MLKYVKKNVKITLSKKKKLLPIFKKIFLVET